MPYITQKQREYIVKTKELGLFVAWLETVSVQQRKGFVAFIVDYIGTYSFTQDYFGKSTGTDAVRSAFIEMQTDLKTYERQKEVENGSI